MTAHILYPAWMRRGGDPVAGGDRQRYPPPDRLRGVLVTDDLAMRALSGGRRRSRFTRWRRGATWRCTARGRRADRNAAGGVPKVSARAVRLAHARGWRRGGGFRWTPGAGRCAGSLLA